MKYRTVSREVEFLFLNADVFSLMRSFDLSPGLGLLPSIQSHSRLLGHNLDG
jgi:hypothetical protein